MIESPFVSIIMITYGHEKFILKAIEGITIQITSFPIELIIADDCSPDRTQKIVLSSLKENVLPENIRIEYTRHTINKGPNANFVWAAEQAKGKYIAICEGDDYWTDPLKLQKQVEILEQNLDYGLSCTACDRYYQEYDTMITPQGIRQDFFITFEELIFKSPIKTCTVVFRKKILDDYLNQIGENVFKWRMGDAPLWLFVSMNSVIHFTNRNTAVYRILEKSATNVSAYKKLLFRMSRYKVSLFFLRQKFSYYIAWKLFVKFIKETPFLILKTILSFLKLYKPNKEKVIKKRIKNKG